MRTYGLRPTFRPELAEADVRSEVATVEAALGSLGATVTASDFWGKRRFAYEIKHLHEGYYALVTFEGDNDAVTTVDRALAISDNVLRHKFVRPE